MRELVGTRFFVEEVVETASTNADLVERASSGAADGLVLRAGHQTAGRGRLGRLWDAPPGSNLLFSVLLKPEWHRDRLPLVTSALAVSLVDVLNHLLVGTAMRAAVKWPNDVVLSATDVEPDAVIAGGKVAGILAELLVGEPPAVVVGMGLNVLWPDGEDDGPSGAISLARVGCRPNPSDLLDDVLRVFEGWCETLGHPDGPQGLQSAHRERSSTVGRFVSVEQLDGHFTGKAVDLADNGALVVDVDGRAVEVWSGDVVHLRMA